MTSSHRSRRPTACALLLRTVRASCLILATCIIGALSAASASAASAVANTMTITDKSGSSSTNYPMQFGRPFVQGEIANYPQVLINGTPTATQADVKNRWPDGSVKMAIIAVMIPSIPANGTVTLSFQNQASGNNTALTQAQMLGSNYNFDAKINISNGTQTLSASARTMLTNGNCTPWTSGQIAQTMLCADDSTSRLYDMGFDSYKSIRPRFYATFWPATNQVTIRYIGENSNSEALEDVQLDLTLTAGSASPQTVYTKSTVIDYAATRWTRTAWLGGTPQARINIDNNIAYLGATYVFPNYDASIRPAESLIAGQYTDWQSRSKDLYDAGNWVIYMPQTGQTAGPAVGPYPAWAALWLYTGDWRMREQTLENANLAGAWPLQVREGQSTRSYLPGVNALGKPISVVARPLLRLFDDRYFVSPWLVDQIKINGSRILNANSQTWNGWTVDNAHEPDPFSAAYTLTGDYYYLEQMDLWSAADAAYVGPEYRGPLGSGYGGIKEQVRGEAWALRNRVNSAILSPDGSPEKTYFTQITNDAIAIWEGQRGITGTAFTGSPQWTWGNQPANIPPQGPLHPWRVDMPALDSDQYQYQGGDAIADGELWMNYMMIYSLGLAKERGFPTGALLTWLAPLLTAQMTETGYDPRFMASYVTPFGDPTSGLYTHWAQTAAKLTSAAQTANLNRFTPGEENTYGIVGATGASMITGESGGNTLWSWSVSNIRNLNDYATILTAWDILPRGAVVPIAPAITAQPLSMTVTVGQTATFTVTANGSPTPTYQWQKNAVNISGATSASYTTPATVIADNGATFRVTVSNSVGSVTSSSATLTVGSTAPTVATAASASPNPTSGATTALSVLGADDGGEANLTYSWAATSGPGTVSFNVNGTNAAKNCTATFSAAGSYVLQATIRDVNAQTVTSNVTVTVNQTVTTIGILPSSASVAPNGTLQFTATANDQFGKPVGSQPSFAWSVSGGGTINGTGLFTAGSVAAGPFTVTATGGGKTGTASVTVASSIAFINFQPTASPVPAGYQMDDGAVFTVARGYGWNAAVESRDRGTANPDPRLTTFVFSSGPVATWSYAVPNGNYLVTFACGDAVYAQGPQRVVLQGTTVVDESAVTPANVFVTKTNLPVTVSTGQLTIAIGGGAGGGYTMLNYVDIKSATGGGTAPSITTQPANQTVSAGQSATFSVVATGTAPLTYQWYKGSTAVGTNSASYTTPATVLADSGSLYHVVVTNSAGTATSNNATLTVNSGGGLPAGWSTSDVGTVAAAGSAGYASGTWTLNGSGAGIWGSADEFRFAYRTMTGDGQIIARVVSQGNTDPWARSGVMIRESLTAGSRYAMAAITPANGVVFQRRLLTGKKSWSTAGALVAAPYWLKLTRVGSRLTAYQSADGVTWQLVNSASVSMAATVYIGLAVTSHNDGVLCTSVFDNVSTIAGPIGSG